MYSYSRSTLLLMTAGTKALIPTGQYLLALRGRYESWIRMFQMEKAI